MLAAAHEALGYAKGHARDDLDRDTMLLRALVKCIEIVGEAASRVGAETKERARDIPWDQITGMHNRLIHAYFDINRDIVWTTVTHDLPLLEPLLTAILDPGGTGA